MTAFLAGMVLASLLALLISARVVRRREANAASVAKMSAETAFLADRSRLETELQHAGQHMQEMREEMDSLKTEAAKNLQAEKDGMDLRIKELRETFELRAREEREAAERRHSEDVARIEARQAKALDDLRKHHAEDIAVRENHHRQVMDDLQKRFDETMAKVSAQLRNDTDELLKTRQL